MSKNIVNNLLETYVRIMPSKIHGVGVVAIREIPAGINPFEHAGNKCGINKMIRVHKDKLEKVDKSVIKMLDDFLGEDKDGYYDVPSGGLNSLDVSFYMNFSNKPNVSIVSDKNCKFATFKTNKVIKKGEELFINYNEY